MNYGIRWVAELDVNTCRHLGTPKAIGWSLMGTFPNAGEVADEHSRVEFALRKLPEMEAPIP